MPEAAQPHFFISYTGADRVWAEWIAWQLEEAGYRVKIQAWDFSPGGNFVAEMQKAIVECERTIAVFSPNYFLSEFGAAEWAAAFRLDPTGKMRGLFACAHRHRGLPNLQFDKVFHSPLTHMPARSHRALRSNVTAINSWHTEPIRLDSIELISYKSQKTKYMPSSEPVSSFLAFHRLTFPITRTISSC